MHKIIRLVQVYVLYVSCHNNLFPRQQTFTFIDGEKQEETGFCIIGRVNEYSRGLGLQFDENGYVKAMSDQ